MSKILVKEREKGHNEELSTSLPRQLDPLSTCESIVTKALQTSTNKMGLGDVKALIACMKEGDSMAFNYYYYNIAKELGEVLGSWDKNIRAVYAHDYDGATPEEACCENTSLFSLIHMIIWAERKTNALDALVETINHAMVQQHRHMLGLINLEYVLDIQVIDDEDVRNRTGHAALLKSIYQPPTQVWRSGPDIQV
ncbi:hypothetical protein ACFLXG_02945 [Chloroflexota bacterium]